MTATTPTPTIELADVHRFAADFLANPNIDVHGLHLYPRSTSLILNDHDYASLRNVHATLDSVDMMAVDHASETHPNGVILAVDGTYRGVRASAQILVTVPADLDLIRSFVDENGKPNPLLLDALVGDSQEG